MHHQLRNRLQKMFLLLQKRTIRDKISRKSQACVPG